MKKLTFCFLLLACLLSCAVLAEEGKPLYAVKDENGLWGYIDCKGNLVIPGTYTWAEDFRGNYALARLIPEGEPVTEYGYFGIIDVYGQWVLPPEYYHVWCLPKSSDFRLLFQQ